MKNIKIYTDGACSGNPGLGGYCAILIYNKYEKVISGAEENTTNNRMEVLAVIKGLKALKEQCNVEIYTDSQYVVNAFNLGWLDNWQRQGWKGADKKAIKNIELWKELLEQVQKHNVTFVKVKGHSDNEYNNKCDKIAVNEYKKLQI